MDLRGADELLTTTRAVRKRLDLERAVPPEVVEECIDIAIQAPTGGNRQGWRWVIVTDADRKKAIADYYRKSWFPYREQRDRDLAELPEGVREQQQRVTDSATYLAENLERAPLYVIPCVLGRPPENAPVGMWAGLFGSIFPAVWSLQLALRARGLGSVLTTLHLAFEREVGELLGIPDTVVQTALLPVAYTKGTDFRPAKRRPGAEITYWNTWKASRDA